MAKKKIPRKELLKSPDEFISLSSRMVTFASEHSRQFTYIGIFLAAVALIYLLVNTYLGYMNKKGQSAYNNAYYSLLKNMKTDGDQKGFKESEELFAKVIDEYGISKVSRLAFPELAYLKFRDKKYDEAISLYQKFLNEFSNNITYQALTKMALAACYEEKKDFDKAIEALKQIMAGADGAFKEQAMFHLARVYKLANQEEKSRKILKEFVEKYQSSPFYPIAKAHLEK